MTLRGKTIFIFGACLLGLVCVLYLAISSILLRGYLKHEREDAIQNVERLRGVINDNLVNLNSTVWDWANWDDLYRFAADANPEFIQTNLQEKTFTELKINLLLIIDASQQLLFAKAFDLSTGKEVPVTRAVTEIPKSIKQKQL
jgi:sensor domain CHASE-containing protein